MDISPSGIVIKAWEINNRKGVFVHDINYFADGHGMYELLFQLFSILRTLQERVIERDLLPGSKQSAEEKAWKVFWGKWGPKLFIHACSNGSVDAVKVFIEMESPQYYDRKAYYYDTIGVES